MSDALARRSVSARSSGNLALYSSFMQVCFAVDTMSSQSPSLSSACFSCAIAFRNLAALRIRDSSAGNRMARLSSDCDAVMMLDEGDAAVISRMLRGAWSGAARIVLVL